MRLATRNPDPGPRTPDPFVGGFGFHPFDDRYRWLKFGLAVLLLAALGVTCGLVVPVIRPSVLRYETRADEFDGRPFALDYQHVRRTHAGHFTVRARRGADLRFTDDARRSAVEQAPAGPVTDAVTVCGVTIRPGDSISVRGTFHKPDLMVLREVRTHPRRRLKYATAVPALLVVAFLAWRRLRRTRRGLVLRPDDGSTV